MSLAGSVRSRRAAGFTLMETLVMLMLVSMAATMMFQILESYRIAQQRIAAQAGSQDRSALFDAWILDGVRGLLALPDKPFKGSKLEFQGNTLSPLYGPSGAPAALRWQLHATADGGEVSYWEDGQLRWTMPLRDFESAHFVYLDEKGDSHDQWPPAKGVQESLPSAIALVRGSGSEQTVRLATVRGPLIPREQPFELEQD